MRITPAIPTACALIVALSVTAAATTHTVDDSGGADFTTMGEAIAVCAAGDTVLVYAGTYTGPQNRGITIDNMNVALIGVSGYLATTIDCEGQDRAFYLTGPHDTTTIFRGLSIVNGNSTSARYPSGGAILMFSGSPALVEDCYFGDNTAGDGGAIAIGTGNVARIRNCVFDGNSATLFGGAVNCNYDDSVIRGCSFTGNTAPEGGAVRLYYSSTVVADCDFVSGNAASNSGGAIWCGECPSSSLVEGCNFTGNTATNGGGMCCWMSEATIEGCTFVANEALSDGGGLRVVAMGELLTISGCTFDGNLAYWGGGAEIGGAPFVMTDCTFLDNQAQVRGGGLCLWEDLVGVLACTFSGNGSVAGQSGGIDVEEGAGTIANTIVAFSAGGSAIVFRGASPEIRHCCIFANAGGDSLPGYHHDNMFLDPLFCAMGSDDYTLCANSFCLPQNNMWFELVGAHGQGCAECGSAVERASWGRIKAFYR